MKFSAAIQGAAELEAKLKALPRKVSGKITRQALRSGAKVVQKQAQADAPRKTGLLARSIKVRAAKRSRGRIGILVQTATGFFKGKSFYSGFIEFGRKTGSRKSAVRREVPADPFMARALEKKKAEAVQVVAAEIRKGIEREAAA